MLKAIGPFSHCPAGADPPDVPGSRVQQLRGLAAAGKHAACSKQAPKRASSAEKSASFFLAVGPVLGSGLDHHQCVGGVEKHRFGWGWWPLADDPLLSCRPLNQ